MVLLRWTDCQALLKTHPAGAVFAKQHFGQIDVPCTADLQLVPQHPSAALDIANSVHLAGTGALRDEFAVYNDVPGG